MKSEAEVIKVIAKNIVHYRKLNRMTQVELAHRISYSDKSVSKWERGDALPDIHALMCISEVFNITVNDLLQDKSSEEIINEVKKKKKSFIFNKFIIAVLSTLLSFFIFAIIFTIAVNVDPYRHYFYLFFIFPLPISSIVWIVFAKLYWPKWVRFLSNSALNWSTSLTLFLTIREFVDIAYLWLVFIISAIYQIMLIFWYLRKRKN